MVEPQKMYFVFLCLPIESRMEGVAMLLQTGVFELQPFILMYLIVCFLLFFTYFVFLSWKRVSFSTWLGGPLSIGRFARYVIQRNCNSIPPVSMLGCVIKFARELWVWTRTLFAVVSVATHWATELHCVCRPYGERKNNFTF